MARGIGYFFFSIQTAGCLWAALIVLLQSVPPQSEVIFGGERERPNLLEAFFGLPRSP